MAAPAPGIAEQIRTGVTSVRARAYDVVKGMGLRAHEEVQDGQQIIIDLLSSFPESRLSSRHAIAAFDTINLLNLEIRPIVNEISRNAHYRAQTPTAHLRGLIDRLHTSTIGFDCGYLLQYRAEDRPISAPVMTLRHERDFEEAEKFADAARRFRDTSNRIGELIVDVEHWQIAISKFTVFKTFYLCPALRPEQAFQDIRDILLEIFPSDRSKPLSLSEVHFAFSGGGGSFNHELWEVIGHDIEQILKIHFRDINWFAASGQRLVEIFHLFDPTGRIDDIMTSGQRIVEIFRLFEQYDWGKDY